MADANPITFPNTSASAPPAPTGAGFPADPRRCAFCKRVPSFYLNFFEVAARGGYAKGCPCCGSTDRPRPANG